MGQEDLLKRQIDKMARALTSILLSQMGFKNLGDIEQVVNYADEALKSKLDLNLSTIIETPDDELVALLTNNYHLSNEHLGTLADILYNSAKAKQAGNMQRSQKLFDKALVLYLHLAAESKNYSFEWHNKIIEISK